MRVRVCVQSCLFLCRQVHQLSHYLSLPQSSSLAFSLCRFLPDTLYSHLLIIPARLWVCVRLHVHMRDILPPAEATC